MAVALAPLAALATASGNGCGCVTMRMATCVEGTRNTYEIPVYGAKCIGVRNGILDMHGKPAVAWTRSRCRSASH